MSCFKSRFFRLRLTYVSWMAKQPRCVAQLPRKTAPHNGAVVFNQHGNDVASVGMESHLEVQDEYYNNNSV